MKNLCILVVEDEPDNFLLIEALLTAHVNELVHAVDGNSALNFFKERAFDIVLLDVKLPDMNGLDLLVKGKEMHPDMIFIALTAYAMPEDRKKAMEAGCTAYLTKPIEESDLLSTIQNVTR